jgi:hypothetical protein
VQQAKQAKQEARAKQVKQDQRVKPAAQDQQVKQVLPEIPDQLVQQVKQV